MVPPSHRALLACIFRPASIASILDQGTEMVRHSGRSGKHTKHRPKRTPPFNPNKNQRSGTPRAVEFPEEWNSQGSSGAPRGVELPGGWSSQGWNSQGACFVFAFHLNTDGRGRGNLIPCLSKIIIVKVEYSSRKRSGLGANMVYQLKVERS